MLVGGANAPASLVQVDMELILKRNGDGIGQNFIHILFDNDENPFLWFYNSFSEWCWIFATSAAVGIIPLDVTKKEDVVALASTIDKIDVIFNCAG